MKICVIVYLLIILFLFILIHPIIHQFLPIQEGMEDCLADTLSDLKNDVAELKRKVEKNESDINKLETPEIPDASPEEQEQGDFLKDNINSV